MDKLTFDFSGLNEGDREYLADIFCREFTVDDWSRVEALVLKCCQQEVDGTNRAFIDTILLGEADAAFVEWYQEPVSVQCDCLRCQRIRSEI